MKVRVKFTNEEVNTIEVEHTANVLEQVARHANRVDRIVVDWVIPSREPASSALMVATAYAVNELVDSLVWYVKHGEMTFDDALVLVKKSSGLMKGIFGHQSIIPAARRILNKE